MAAKRRNKSKGGRPKGTVREVEIIHIRVSPAVKEATANDAHRRGLSLTQNVERLLAAAFGLPWPAGIEEEPVQQGQPT